MESVRFSLNRWFHSRTNSLAGTSRLRRDARATNVGPHVEELEPRLVLSIPTPEHVVLVIEENHGYSQIIGSPYAPYLNQLAQEGALFTDSYAVEHPSQPNYLDLFSGSNQGITDDSTPHYFSGPDLGGELLGAGLTFAGYSEDLPSPGFTGSMNQKYGRNHNPWVDFTDVPAEDNLPFQGYFPSDYSQLPTVAIVVPSKNDDMHDGMDPARIEAGDQWLQSNLDPYVQWAYANNSLLIVTFDEDNNMEGNHIATLFVGPMVQPGQYDEYINHYTVLATLEDMYNLPLTGESANVDHPITDIWTTQPGPATQLSIVPAVTSTTAGSSFSITVTALDANNNPVPSYSGTVHFTSTDPGASLPPDYTFTANDGGQHVFDSGVTLVSAGNQTLTVSDMVNQITGSVVVAVSPAAADHLSVEAPPEVTAGMPFDITVTALDPFDNIDNNYTGTVTFSSSDPDPGVVLPADYTFASDDAGVHAFPGSVALITPGDQTITVNDLAAGISGTVSVTVDSPGNPPGGFSSTPPWNQPWQAGTGLPNALPLESLSVMPSPAAVAAERMIPLAPDEKSVDRLFAAKQPPVSLDRLFWTPFGNDDADCTGPDCL
jgi:hypothetical protein